MGLGETMFSFWLRSGISSGVAARQKEARQPWYRGGGCWGCMDSEADLPSCIHDVALRAFSVGDYSSILLQNGHAKATRALIKRVVGVPRDIEDFGMQK